jgi:stress-induced-phosphoprotein 1
LQFYGEAIEKDPEEITFHTNKAAVYFEMKDYDACIKACDEGLEITKKGSYDYGKAAKAMSRKANALL